MKPIGLSTKDIHALETLLLSGSPYCKAGQKFELVRLNDSDVYSGDPGKSEGSEDKID